MTRMSILIVTLLLFGACLYEPAHAQSDSDLRRENQRLQAENEDLRRELEAARLRIAELEQETARLRRLLQETRRGPAPPVDPDDEGPLEPVSIDESDPAASPRAMLLALIASYDETLAEKDAGLPRTPEREQYLRVLRQWRDKMHRDFRRVHIEWHVRILEAAPTDAGYTMRLVVIDPVNGAQLGSPFIFQLPRRIARRYEQEVARGEVGVYVLRGWITPSIIINESRLAPGPFNNPPFIGVFAEFTHAIEPRNFLPAGEPAAEDER